MLSAYHPQYYREDTEDAAIFANVCSGNEYGGVEVADKTVVDIGAHIGGFTHYAVRQRAKAIHAFEPHLDNFRYLALNCAQMPQVTLNYCAVWWNDTDQLCSQPTNKTNTGGAQIVPAKGKQPTPQIRLENYMFQHQISQIDVLKLDCEGSEFPILYGLPKSCLANISLIIGEYHNGYAQELYPYSPAKQPHIKSLLRYLSRCGFVGSVQRQGDENLGVFIARRKKQ